MNWLAVLVSVPLLLAQSSTRAIAQPPVLIQVVPEQQRPAGVRNLDISDLHLTCIYIRKDGSELKISAIIRIMPDDPNFLGTRATVHIDGGGPDIAGDHPGTMGGTPMRGIMRFNLPVALDSPALRHAVDFEQTAEPRKSGEWEGYYVSTIFSSKEDIGWADALGYCHQQRNSGHEVRKIRP